MKLWTRFTGWTGPLRDKHSHEGDEGDEGDKERGGNTKCAGCGTSALLLSVLHRAAAAVAAAASLFA